MFKTAHELIIWGKTGLFRTEFCHEYQQPLLLCFLLVPTLLTWTQLNCVLDMGSHGFGGIKMCVTSIPNNALKLHFRRLLNHLQSLCWLVTLGLQETQHYLNDSFFKLTVCLKKCHKQILYCINKITCTSVALLGPEKLLLYSTSPQPHPKCHQLPSPTKQWHYYNTPM